MIAGLRAARLGWHGIDRRIASRASRGGRLAVFAHELVWFGVKQAWACLFGALMLALLIATWMFWSAHAPLARYDFVTLMAVAIQFALLASGLETRREACVIVLFHVTGTSMELFKTATGSWIYPGISVLHIGGVPLFTGFMYAAVGSYIARAWRVFEFRFTGHPRWSHTALLAVAIYLNFFIDHYRLDLRWLLFVAVAWLFGPCRVHYRVRSASFMSITMSQTIDALRKRAAHQQFRHRAPNLPGSFFVGQGSRLTGVPTACNTWTSKEPLDFPTRRGLT